MRALDIYYYYIYSLINSLALKIKPKLKTSVRQRIALELL